MLRTIKIGTSASRDVGKYTTLRNLTDLKKHFSTYGLTLPDIESRFNIHVEKDLVGKPLFVRVDGSNIEIEVLEPITYVAMASAS